MIRLIAIAAVSVLAAPAFADRIDITQVGPGTTTMSATFTHSFIVHWTSIAAADPANPTIDPSVSFLGMGEAGFGPRTISMLRNTPMSMSRELLTANHGFRIPVYAA